jgi:AraC-like DNA-binding protein
MAVAQLIFRNLADARPLANLCADLGVGVRTVQRIYRRELGIDIDTWRRQARLTKAVQLLIAGRSVKEVSFSVGYRQSSAFVEAFRTLFGSTPRVWTASLRNAQSSHTSLKD